MASLTHHALLRPEHLYRRIGPADELIRDGFRGSNGVLALVELVWRTVGLYELGDPSAELGLADVREWADAREWRPWPTSCRVWMS
jgi:hypothetical protein